MTFDEELEMAVRHGRMAAGAELSYVVSARPEGTSTIWVDRWFAAQFPVAFRDDTDAVQREAERACDADRARRRHGRDSFDRCHPDPGIPGCTWVSRAPPWSMTTADAQWLAEFRAAREKTA